MALDADNAHLAVISPVVLVQESLKCNGSGLPVAEVGQACALVGDVHPRLGGCRARAGTGRGNDGPYGEELGRDGDAPRLPVV